MKILFKQFLCVENIFCGLKKKVRDLFDILISEKRLKNDKFVLFE